MAKKRHLPLRDTRRTEATPFVEHRAPTEVLPVEIIAWRATFFIFSLLQLILATQFFNLSRLLFKPKGQDFKEYNFSTKE